MEENQEKKEEFPPSWGSFLSFVGFFILTVFFGEGWVVPLGGLMFGAFAILSFPNRKIHDWIMLQVSNLGKLTWFLIKIGFYLLLIAGGFWFIGKIIDSFASMGKYQGQTAEEWYYEYSYAEDNYQELYDCVEDHVYYGEYSALEDIEYDCL